MAKILCITGMDGCGKSTVCGSLYTHYQKTWGENQIAILGSKELYSKFQKLIADIAPEKYFNELDSVARWQLLLFAYSASIAKLQKNPELKLILIDGYWYKYAAMELAKGQDYNKIIQSARMLTTPDFVVCLQVSPETAWQRKLNRKEQDNLGFLDANPSEILEIFLSYQKRTQEALLSFGNFINNWTTLSSEQSLEQITNHFKQRMDKIFDKE